MEVLWKAGPVAELQTMWKTTLCVRPWTGILPGVPGQNPSTTKASGFNQTAYRSLSNYNRADCDERSGIPGDGVQWSLCLESHHSAVGGMGSTLRPPDAESTMVASSYFDVPPHRLHPLGAEYVVFVEPRATGRIVAGTMDLPGKLPCHGSWRGPA